MLVRVMQYKNNTDHQYDIVVRQCHSGLKASQQLNIHWIISKRDKPK